MMFHPAVGCVELGPQNHLALCWWLIAGGTTKRPLFYTGMNPLPKAQSKVWILRLPVGNVIQSGWAKSKSVAEDSDMGKLCVRKRRLVGNGSNSKQDNLMKPLNAQEFRNSNLTT